MLLLFLAAVAVPAAAQVTVTYVRHPPAVARALVAPGRPPAGMSTWQVAAVNGGAAAVQMDHAAVLAAAARCVAVVDPVIALAVVQHAQENSRKRRAWRALGIGTDVAAAVIPTAQVTGVIKLAKAAPYVSFALLGADVVARLARAETKPLEHPPGVWLRPGESTEIAAGRGAMWLMVAGSQGPPRFTLTLGAEPSFETGRGRDSWGCR